MGSLVGECVDVKRFHMLHPWILTEPLPNVEGLPPRRFASEECALQSRGLSGGIVVRDPAVPLYTAAALRDMRDGEDLCP